MSVSAGSVKMLKSNGGSNSESGSTRSTRFRFLSWSPETYAIREFLASFPLPRVVRLTNCDEANLLKTLVLPSDVDISQPLLLYKKYRPTKVLAKCLKIHKNGKWKETGPTVVIPESFPGWFTLLNQEGKECALTLTSMGQVAAARIPAFLTKFDVPVYKLTDSSEPGSKSVYVRSIMKAGSVLRLLGVWADLGGANKGFPSSTSGPYQQKSSGFLGGSLGAFGGRLMARSLSLQNSQPQQQFQYVQCLSLENEILFIPFSATGVFYPIAPRGGRNPQHVYPLSAIARINRLPLRTRMVFGTMSAILPDFTGTFQVERVDTEEVVLACTLLREKPTLFEVDIDCDLFLSQMTSEDLFIKSTGYQSALTFCSTEADSWRRQIRPYQFGSKVGKGGTVTGAYVLSVRDKNKSLKIRSSPPPPSKLSLLFRPSSAPFGSNKDLLKRSKSFNVEVQSVSISLTQDEEEEETKKLSTLFNFMAGKKNKSKHNQAQLQLLQAQQSLQPQPQLLRESDKELYHDHLQRRLPPQAINTSELDVNVHKLRSKSQQQYHNGLGHIQQNQQSNIQPFNQSVPDVLSNYKNQISHSNQMRSVSSRSHHNHRHVLSVHCNANSSTGSASNNSSTCTSSLGNSSSISLSPILHSNTSNSSNGSPICSSSSGGNGSPDVPYGTVIDEVSEEENIYSEIADAFTMKLSLNPIHQMGLNFHHQLNRHPNSSNISSLLKGGGGSDGAFSGTLSGTFSSSNPSNREEDIYDAVF